MKCKDHRNCRCVALHQENMDTAGEAQHQGDLIVKRVEGAWNQYLMGAVTFAELMAVVTTFTSLAVLYQTNMEQAEMFNLEATDGKA
jgi:hypothetical protein